MKIVVTGATGFIGRNVAESLNNNGFQVIATGRSEKIGKELQVQGITFNSADIRNPQQLKEAILPADVLIHCAAKTADWGIYKDFYDINVNGTRNIIEICKQKGIKKIVYVSTPSVYFSGKDRFNIEEKERLPRKQFSYGKTKLIAENDLLTLSLEGVRTIILRPRAVHGKYDSTIVPRILKLSEKNRVPLINGGNALVDITSVENLTSAIQNCLFAPDRAWNKIYNITNGTPVTIKELFSTVFKLFERPFKPVNISLPIAKAMASFMELIGYLPFSNNKPELTRFSVGYMGCSMTLSIERAKKELNYSPHISNLEGFIKYKKWIADPDAETSDE